MKVLLPLEDNVREEYVLNGEEPLRPATGVRFQSRVAFAAAHVIIDPVATIDPIRDCKLDYDATMAYRNYLWSLGFAIAEAMDTAQRGMGLGWNDARELIRRSCDAAKAVRGSIACGANTDQLPQAEASGLDAVIAAYEEQCSFIESCGAQVILMASRSLARSARNPDDYLRVYRRILSQVSRPVILHWLGADFDPSLRGYWGGATVEQSMEIVLTLIKDCRKAVDGIKISLLDKEREIEMRRRLPAGVRMYTGDDFHYPELIEGDSKGYSDALLGIFSAIAPAAALAFQELDKGNTEAYRRLLLPTLPLSRHMFQRPTYYYKTGIVFLSFLNGWQNHFRMLGGQESARSAIHLAQIFKYADQARLLADPERAVARLQSVLSLSGIG